MEKREIEETEEESRCAKRHIRVDEGSVERRGVEGGGGGPARKEEVDRKERREAVRK